MADIASTSTIQATPASPAAQNLSDEQELNEFREIVWGSNIRLDVFQRWSQGLFRLFIIPFHRQLDSVQLSVPLKMHSKVHIYVEFNEKNMTLMTMNVIIHIHAYIDGLHSNVKYLLKHMHRYLFWTNFHRNILKSTISVF